MLSTGRGVPVSDTGSGSGGKRRFLDDLRKIASDDSPQGGASESNAAARFAPPGTPLHGQRRGGGRVARPASERTLHAGASVPARNPAGDVCALHTSAGEGTSGPRRPLPCPPSPLHRITPPLAASQSPTGAYSALAHARSTGSQADHGGAPSLTPTNVLLPCTPLKTRRSPLTRDEVARLAQVSTTLRTPGLKAKRRDPVTDTPRKRQKVDGTENVEDGGELRNAYSDTPVVSRPAASSRPGSGIFSGPTMGGTTLPKSCRGLRRPPKSCPPQLERIPRANSPLPRKQFEFSPRFNAPRRKEGLVDERQRLERLSFDRKQSAEKSKGVTLFDLTPIPRRMRLNAVLAPGSPSPDVLVDKFNLSEEILRMTLKSAKDYVFDSGEDAMEMRLLLLRDGASESEATEEWVSNHYAQIVWKHASMERSDPQRCAHTCLTPVRTLAQLKYRYEREFNRKQRSALKQIYERDEPPHQHLILCVSEICSFGDAMTGDGANDEGDSRAVVELTDGWYSIHAHLDAVLTEVTAMGKIFVGQKLHVFGAKLAGSIDGASPLDSHGSVWLTVGANGVRRCRWDAQLGFQKRLTFPVNIPSIHSTGGVVPSISVQIVRVYPMLYYEKDNDTGQKIAIRNEKMELQAAEEVQTRREEAMQRIEKEMVAEAQKPPVFGRKRPSQSITEASTPQELYEYFKACKSQDSFVHSLSLSQREQLRHYEQEEAMRFRDKVQKTVQEHFENTPGLSRNVTPFLRIKVADFCGEPVSDPAHRSCALLTIWRPPPELTAELREGLWFRIHGLEPGNFSRTSVQLIRLDEEDMGDTTARERRRTESADVRSLPQLRSTRATHYQKITGSQCDALPDVTRRMTALAELTTMSSKTEFDTLVYQVVAPFVVGGGQETRHVGFYADESGTLLAVEVGEKTPVVIPALIGRRPIVAMQNLSYEHRDRTRDLQVANATDCTVFVVTDSLAYMHERFVEMHNAGDTILKMLEDCRVRVMAITSAPVDERLTDAERAKKEEELDAACLALF